MPVPNTLIKMINKNAQVESFQISKVQNAISKCIIDVENATSWEAQERAFKYADMVKENAYNNFYNIDFLAEFFTRVIRSFDKSEREIRISRVEFASRFTTLLLLHYISEKKIQLLNDKNSSELTDFIGAVFAKYLTDKALWREVTALFVKKVMLKSKEGLKDSDYFPTRDYIQDQIETTLKDIGEVMIAEGFMIFREGKKKIMQNEISKAQFTHNGIHKERVRQTLTWNIQHECDTVFGLNDWIIGRNGKSFKELMKLSDQRFYNDIASVVTKIVGRKNEIKVVIIAGPSCSNKTTTTTIIEKELEKNGLKLKQLNIDDYFYNLSEHPKDEFGDYDYEMPEAIDIPLLNENLKDLISGKTIKRPKYNFKTGMRDGYTDFKVGKDEIILIDCLHGLFQKLTASVPSRNKFKIYTESANMLRSSDSSYTMWTDIRLLKRMIRDSLYRAYEAKKTLEHWFYVRKGELKHIIPYVYSVDAVLNSGLPYELPILKAVLKDKLPDKKYLNELLAQGRLDAYIRGIRLLSLLDTVLEYPQIEDVDRFSPIREFIGGSGYEIAHNE